MKNNLRCTIALLLLALAHPCAAFVVEEVVELPVTVKTIYGKSVSHPFKVTVFHDNAVHRSPFVVINHGRAVKKEDRAKIGRARYADISRYLMGKGFAVFVPTRIGYGETGGEDVEDTGSCQGKNYPPGYEAAAEQTRKVLDHARSLPYVDANRGLVIGQSFGGATAITIAADNPQGVVATVNFAGGGGGNPIDFPEKPCRNDLLTRMFADYGKTAKIPTLWVYSENDRYFGKERPREWFKAFQDAGGKGEFVQLPAHGKDGHPSFTSNPTAWKPAFEDFLRRNGF